MALQRVAALLRCFSRMPMGCLCRQARTNACLPTNAPQGVMTRVPDAPVPVPGWGPAVVLALALALEVFQHDLWHDDVLHIYSLVHFLR